LAQDTTHVWLRGDHTATWFHLGIGVSWELTPSLLGLQDRRGIPYPTSGRLNISRVFVHFEDTGYVSVLVDPGQNRNTHERAFDQRTIGWDLAADTLYIKDGVLSVPVGVENKNVTITIHGETPLPARLTLLEWEGNYWQRTRRVN
jgi:hypothetical protein